MELSLFEGGGLNEGAEGGGEGDVTSKKEATEDDEMLLLMQLQQQEDDAARYADRPGNDMRLRITLMKKECPPSLLRIRLLPSNRQSVYPELSII